MLLSSVETYIQAQIASCACAYNKTKQKKNTIRIQQAKHG